jgi:uncharacterized protein (DUF849 family)
VLPFATSGTSWTALMLGVVWAARRSRVPTPVAAVVLGGAVAVGDSLLIEVGERAKAKAVEMRAARAAEAAEASPGQPDKSAP